jgi:hypothetical protein
MKKSRMLLLFGGLFLMLVGYGAWCGRTFYLRAPMPDLSNVPAEARAIVRSEIGAADMRRPEEFTMTRFQELLAHPYESDPASIFVETSTQGLILVRRGDHYAGTFIIGRSFNDWAVLIRPQR